MNRALCILFCIAILLSFLGCGSNSKTSSNKAAIAFELEWEQPKTISYASSTGDVCTDYGISTINATVYDSSDRQIATQSYNCSDHQGTLQTPSGSNMKLVIEGVELSR